MKAWVYILYFDTSDKFYVGSTTNLARRLKQHGAGHTPSTKRLGGEFKLVFSQKTNSVSIARNAENKIKSWKRRDFIEKIVSDGKVKFLEK